MKYDDPDLREHLAAEYILGTMPYRARARLERLMREDASLAQVVGRWAERFSAIDRASPAEEPPARVWRAIEARIAPAPNAPAALSSLRAALRLWRGLAIGASAAAAALVIYIAVALTGAAPQQPRTLAILADHSGTPSWLVTVAPRRGEIAVAALRQIKPGPHSFELWGIARGAPRPIGLLRPQPGGEALLSAKEVPAPGGILAVSLEPRGGSPTGLPTGPVLYQGKVLPRS